MRTLPAVLLLAASACVATQVSLHRCPAPCPNGEVCDASVGECKPDPCGGKCNPEAQRCRAGPPPHCVDLNMGEAHVTGPAEPSSPQQPIPPGALQSR